MRNTLGLLRYALVLTTLGLLAGDPDVLFARSTTVPICEEVCTGSTECTTECYENMMEFENGNDITCYEYDVWDYDQLCCFDGVCNLGAEESCGNCASDCGPCLSTPPTCGQYGCQVGENCENCAQDCGGCGTAPECDYDDQCEDGEDDYCQDCQVTGFCEENSDCPDFKGGLFDYVCVDDRCVLAHLPFVTSTCQNDIQCQSGWKCKDKPSYNGETYICPGPNPNAGCRVCLPPWIET